METRKDNLSRKKRQRKPIQPLGPQINVRVNWAVIDAWRITKKLTQKRFSQLCGISIAATQRLCSGEEVDCLVSTLVKVAYATGLRLEALILVTPAPMGAEKISEEKHADK